MGILLKGDDAIETEAAMGDLSAVSPIYTVALIVFVLLILFVVFFVLKGIASGNIKKTLLSVGAFLLIVIIGYVMSSGSLDGLPADLIQTENVTEKTSKWVGAGLNTFYILAILAVGSMIFSGFKKVT